MKPPRYRKPRAGEESVWDYPRPPRIEALDKLVKVEFAGILLARSRRAMRVLETASPPTIYIPPSDVQVKYLYPSTHGSICEWKGRARYWSVEVGGRRVENVSWSYPDPTPDFESIRDYLSFYAGRVDTCMLGEDRVVPQAGDFYGGWITPGIIGPFKGEPGTGGW